MRTPQIPLKQDISTSFFANGGINTSILPNEIENNQSPDLLNIWYKNKFLRMRPALIKEIEQTYGAIVDVYPKNGELLLLNKTMLNGIVTVETYGIYIVTASSVLQYDGTTITRVPTDYTYYDGVWSPLYTDYDFRKSTIISSNKLNKIDLSGTYFIESNIVYIFYIGGIMQISATYYMVVSPPDDYSTVAIGMSLTENIYIPTMMINTTPLAGGDPLEPRNVLNPQVIQKFTTNNTNLVYQLADKNLDNKFVFITYNNLIGGNLEWDLSGDFPSSTSWGITATLNRTNGTITFSEALVNASAANANNNMPVTYSKTVYPSPDMYKCTLSAWFGGSYQGQESGDYLFLGGNPDAPTAIYWSKPTTDDSLYFPELSKNFIGSPSDPITAFNKQFGIMAIFKKNSIYSASYFYDFTTKISSIPISEVHVGIGCDMPDSIQLINNVLVWAESKGGIHILLSTAIKDERVIRPMSKNINPLLLSESLTDLQNATSIDTGYYYMLFVGYNVYLWDYNSTSYINYSDIDKSQNRLAWYKWTLPKKITNAFMMNGEVHGVASSDNFIYKLDETQTTDDGTQFDAYLYSKNFDFGLSDISKQVNRAVVTMASKDSVTVQLSFKDDCGYIDIFENLDNFDIETAKTYLYNSVSSFTQYFQLEIKRVDNSMFGIGDIKLNAKVGRNIT